MGVNSILENFSILNEDEKNEIIQAGFDDKTIEEFDVIDHFIYKGKQDTVAKIIDNGFNIDTQNHYGWSFLHMAIRHDKIEILNYLLEKKADFNIKDGVGWTPLMEAVMDDKIKMVQILINIGVDKNIANDRGATAKNLVMKFGRNSMMDIF